ncbi:MAG: hypothetical protein R2836_06840 [Chitinophagales bacterium]
MEVRRIHRWKEITYCWDKDNCRDLRLYGNGGSTGGGTAGGTQQAVQQHIEMGM